jgi:transcription initiation factor TFIIE subunit alpha
MLDEKVKMESKPSQEKMELRCPRCKSEYTIMDVMDNLDPDSGGSGFLCKRCGSPLSMISADAAEPDARDDTPAKFNKQFGRILTLLQKIDNEVIPAITGQQALDAMIPVPRNDVFNPGARLIPVTAPVMRPQAVKGVATGPEKIEISITTDADNTAEQQAAEADRKAKIAAQNQLPEWHTHSTVTGELTAAGVRASNAALENGTSVGIKDEDQDEKKIDEPTLDDYWANYAQELAREQAQASADASEEEDDDEFEDVSVAAPASADGTPNAKRLRIEESMAPAQTPTPGATHGAGADGESDEDEFEDAI